MTPSFSLHLHLLRLAAALAVFFEHLASYPFTRDTVWPRLHAYGTIAVTIFFLLSGYVIAYVVSTRERTAKQYLVGRASRLYSVIPIALLLTFVFDTIGMMVNPAFYTIPKVLMKPESWAGYLSSAVFLNEFQVFRFDGISPGTNNPFWSLSFEGAYYLIAGLVLFSRRIIWVPASLLILALAGRTIIALLPIWVLGYGLYHARVRLALPAVASWFAFLASAGFVLALPDIARHLPSDNFGVRFPWGRGPYNRNLVQDYLTAVALSVHLIAARQVLASSVRIHATVKATLEWAGSLTFPLYCIHYPVICLLVAISPWPNTSGVHLAFVGLTTGAVVIGVTPVCEGVKGWLRRRLLPAVIGRTAKG